MGKREEKFTENLDKLLAGQRSEPLHLRDDEETLDFARKMASLRPSPRPEFKSRLKATLLRRLAENEARKAARPNWIQALARRPAYAVALAALFIVVIFGGLWASGVFNPSETPFTPTVIRVDADTGKDSYRRGEQVTINISLKNITSETLNFNEFPPIVSLMNESDHMAAYTFAAGTQGRSLAPGETASFALTWDQRDAQGKQVAAGRYSLELEDLYYQGAVVKLTPVEPVEFRIV